MTNNPRQPFSRRHGYTPSDREIIIREEAPEEFRAIVLHMSEEVGLQPSTLLSIMCRILRKLDRSNWSGSYILSLFADIERELMSLRTKEGLAAARAAGKRLGRSKGHLGRSKLNGKEDEIPKF